MKVESIAIIEDDEKVSQYLAEQIQLNIQVKDLRIFRDGETALQELDETDYWLELLVKSDIVSAQKIASLRKETNELLAIFTTIVTKIKRRMGKI